MDMQPLARSIALVDEIIEKCEAAGTKATQTMLQEMSGFMMMRLPPGVEVVLVDRNSTPATCEALCSEMQQRALDQGAAIGLDTEWAKVEDGSPKVVLLQMADDVRCILIRMEQLDQPVPENYPCLVT